MKVYNIEQGSDEWFNVRKGKVTGSHAQAIATSGVGLDTYINKILAEIYSSQEPERYTNKDLERGNELESQARTIYELENDVEVKQVGFVEYNEYVGVSPDGLINKDGLIEVKCPNDIIYMDILMNEKIPSSYIWQIQMNLLVIKREWCDLMFYNPNFKKSNMVFRIEPNKEKFDKLLKGFEVAEQKIKKLKDKYNKLSHHS